MTPPSTLIDRLGLAWKELDGWLSRWGWAPTAEGLLWFLFSAVVMVQGLSRGFNLVTFIAAFLLSMWLINMIVALFSGKRLKQLQCKRRLHGVVHAGAPAWASLEVHNSGLTTVSGVRCQEQTPGNQQTIGLSLLRPLKTQEIKYQLVPAVRGYYRWAPLRVSTAYPYGLARRTVTLPAHERESIVLPMLGELNHQRFQQWLRHSRRASSWQTRQRAKRSVAPADFYGIRNYRAGDSARWIHWRTTARVGAPMVREFEEPLQDLMTVVLEAWLPEDEATIRSAWKRLHTQYLTELRKEYSTTGKPNALETANDLEELRGKERTVTMPLDLVEQSISLTSSLCFTWTRRLGSNITLCVIDGNKDLPVLLESGPNLRQLTPLMERLALTKACTQPSIDAVAQGLKKFGSRSGTILLISTRNSPLASNLSQALNRPVQLLDVTDQAQVERFFTCPVRAM